jgi:hypothetical protein
VPAVAYIAEQKDLDGTTKFTLAIADKAESSYSLSTFCVYFDEAATPYTGGSANESKYCKVGEFEDGDTFEVVGSSSVQMIKKVMYVVD